MWRKADKPVRKLLSKQVLQTSTQQQNNLNEIDNNINCNNENETAVNNNCVDKIVDSNTSSLPSSSLTKENNVS